MTESPADFAICSHDRRPGIAVCLRCRAESHRKAAAARRRLATRVGVGLLGVLVLAAAANNAVAARGATVQPRVAATAANGGGAAESFQVAQASASEATHATPSAPRLAPVIDAGRTDMLAGRYVERSGDSVTVHFDTPVFRTRRADKFELVVRATLPAIYGAYADSVLAGVPSGELATSGDLLTDLPARGVALPARDGWRLTLWPGTRPGHDGPLVVSYRISLARAQ
ncbi:MAG: hypothetical protein JWN79_1399 [Gemmatimonadetes bacterium]|nr:hypothetical protein [Gemmatimonadota bacterium]